MKNTLWTVWVVSLFIKVLLIPAYHSTDFDVHRNWLAITSKLPLAQWYTENTLQWTLDYPPFFAYFEWVLAQFVPTAVATDGCLDIVPVGAYSMPTVYFQRATVLVLESVLYFALRYYSNTLPDPVLALVVSASLLLLPGLLIVDHIHFQYNGMMYGLLVLVVACARNRNMPACAAWFAVLLCFKHIYLYLAPAVFVYLLLGYAMNVAYDSRRSVWANVCALVRWRRLATLGGIVVAIAAVAFGPFVYAGVMPQLVARLFPFSRGLTHAYWAPNIWAVYAFLDRVLIQAYVRIPLARLLLQKILHVDPTLFTSKLMQTSTRGLVGDTEFLVLPNITPKASFLLTLFYQIMALIPLFLQPTYERFLGALTLCGYASFLFGWHVHEKAVLLIIFPLTFLVPEDKRLLSSFNLLTACGHASLFPLIFTCQEWLVKVLYATLWYFVFYVVFRKVVRVPTNSTALSFDRLSSLYVLGLIPMTIFVTLMDVLSHKFEILQRLEFMKLMIVSVYCGVGVIGSWNSFNWLYFVDDEIWALGEQKAETKVA